MAVQRGESKSAGRARPESRYQLETVARACLVLRAFATDEEVLGLADIARRTGCEKTIVFRIIRTLEHEGFLRKVEDRRYATNVRLLRPKRFRVGYASQTSNSPFSLAIEQSLRRAASKSEVDLIVFDNHYSGKIALRRARQMIEERVDLAIEFQIHDSVAPLVSDMFHAAKIPLIAVEIPHPGGVFYGVDNYNAGVIAGRALAKWVNRAWEGRADELLLLELKMAGSIPLLRLKGIEAVVNEAVPGIRVIRMDTRGEFARALAGVRKRLQSAPAVKTLIAGVNDPSVLGALAGVRRVGPPAIMCRRGARSHTGGAPGIAPPWHQADWVGRIFPRALREGFGRTGLGHSPQAACAVRGFRRASTAHSRQRRQPISKRWREDGRVPRNTIAPVQPSR